MKRIIVILLACALLCVGLFVVAHSPQEKSCDEAAAHQKMTYIAQRISPALEGRSEKAMGTAWQRISEAAGALEQGQIEDACRMMDAIIKDYRLK